MSYLSRLLFNVVKHPPRASAACGGQLLILLRCLASLSLQGREESERLPFGRSPNAPFPQPKGRWEDLSMASTLPPLCETEGREQRLSFFLKMASLFLFFLPCWWNLVEISHLAAGFPGHYTQQRNKAVAYGCSAWAHKNQNVICKSQVPESKKDNNLYTGEEEDVELVGWVRRGWALLNILPNAIICAKTVSGSYFPQWNRKIFHRCHPCPYFVVQFHCI